MSTGAPVDTAALNLMLSELRLPTIKALWPQFTAQADREGWPAARLLAALLPGIGVAGETESEVRQLVSLARGVVAAPPLQVA